VTTTDATERCDECSMPTAGEGLVLHGLGIFHRECLQPCACGWLWPWSLVSSAEVAQYCDGCARRFGGSHDAA
jgi:hypothetical protein